MIHPAFREAFLVDRKRELELHARRALLAASPERRPRHVERVALRLCTVLDGAALSALAALEGRPLPHGSFVVAEVDGALTAAQPLSGGPPLADPFRDTASVVQLLRFRARQLEPGRDRNRLLARSWSAVRGS